MPSRRWIAHLALFSETAADSALAPLIWLDSGDSYFPSPVDGFLNYTTPKVNNVTVVDAPSPLTLSNLADLNSKGGTNVALCSNDDFTKYPPWLNGSKPDGSHKTAGDPSAAIIVNDKGNNTVIAFYMYFYNFNQGNDVLGTPAGNHLGDWEHNAIWFKDGKPQSVWYSQHSDGEAFTYSATQKSGQRPLSYSARGSHANYAKSGVCVPLRSIPPRLILTLDPRSHDSRRQPPRRHRPERLHEPGHALGPDAQRLHVRVRRGRERVHRVQRRGPDVVAHVPGHLGRPDAAVQRSAPARGFRHRGVGRVDGGTDGSGRQEAGPWADLSDHTLHNTADFDGQVRTCLEVSVRCVLCVFKKCTKCHILRVGHTPTSNQCLAKA